MFWSVVLDNISKDVLVWVNYIFLKDVTSYNSLCTLNEWNIPGQGWEILVRIVEYLMGWGGASIQISREEKSL